MAIREQSVMVMVMVVAHSMGSLGPQPKCISLVQASCANYPTGVHCTWMRVFQL